MVPRRPNLLFATRRRRRGESAAFGNESEREARMSKGTLVLLVIVLLVLAAIGWVAGGVVWAD
jgi:hypothetical protein